jgi:hypothetical protein
MKNKILKIIDEMNLRDNNDLIFLFSYVQKFILKNKVSNNEMKRQIYLELHIDMPTNAYYGDIINKLFDWKKNESKIKEVKCVYEKSQYFERFIEIKDKFDSLK